MRIEDNMTDRITISWLKHRVKLLNVALLRKGITALYAIDNYNPGGNPYRYKLVELLPDGAYHPITNYWMTNKEFFAYLNGMLDMLDMLNK